MSGYLSLPPLAFRQVYPGAMTVIAMQRQP
jgi:hypothetical protein